MCDLAHPRDLRLTSIGDLRFGELAVLGYELWALGLAAWLACGFLNTVASSGSAVSLPILIP
jgi:hypothetical protein